MRLICYPDSYLLTEFGIQMPLPGTKKKEQGETMSFLKENWFIIIVGFVVVSVGMFIFWRNDVPQEPVVIYKTTQPSKPRTNVRNPAAHSHDPGHSHNHSHDTTPRSHTVQKSPNDAAYDWRDDGAFDMPPPKTDPWKNLDVQQADTAAASREDSEVYPPPNWHLTEDPGLFVEAPCFLKGLGIFHRCTSLWRTSENVSWDYLRPLTTSLPILKPSIISFREKTPYVHLNVREN